MTNATNHPGTDGQTPRVLFVAIDGGATKTVLRIATADRTDIATGTGGPANVASDLEQAIASIRTALTPALIAAKATPEDLVDGRVRLYAGGGLAGAETFGDPERLLEAFPEFTRFSVRTDAYTSCLGAHAGQPGAVIAIGTGTVGYAISGSQHRRVGGWGFPQGDEGGGAWIGLQAIRHLLRSYDGREKPSGLSEDLQRHFQMSGISDPLTWCVGATASHFASLAPLVVTAARKDDETSSRILTAAAAEVALLADALLKDETYSSVRLCLLGGLAGTLTPYLPARMQARLHPPLGTAVDGAAHLAYEAYRDALS